MRQRALDLNQRIRESEIFPRIRDAEKAMAEEQVLFAKRREKKKKKRIQEQKRRDHSTVLPAIRNGSTNNKSPSKSPSQKQLDYFTGFVLNKDPRCASYMPFNEVFFPALFNVPQPDCPNPHSIDMLWMLGFQHDALHESKVVEEKIEFKT
jgi:hypothetical protein